MIHSEKYEIRCDILFELGQHDSYFIGNLARFMSGEMQWKSITELRRIYNKFIGVTEPCSQLINEEELIEDMKTYGFYFGSQKAKYYVQYGPHKGKRQGVLLDQPIIIDYYNPYHQESYFYFFAYYFSKMPLGLHEEFLAFHLVRTFKNDRKKYRRFLIKLIEDEEGRLMLLSHIRLINQWIEDELSNSETKKLRENDSSLADEQITLERLVVPISKLQNLRTKLVELEILAPHTFQWKDKSKGNKAKAAALIQSLENKGYFGKKRLEPKEIVELIKNSFGLSITTRTVNESIKSEKVNEFKSIPIYSQIS